MSAGGFRGGRCWASALLTAGMKLFSAVGGAHPLTVFGANFVTTADQVGRRHCTVVHVGQIRLGLGSSGSQPGQQARI